MFLYGALALVGVVVWLVVGRERRVEGRQLTTPSLSDLCAVLRSRMTLLLQFAVAGGFAMYTGITSWLQSYYHEVRDMTLSEASAITGLLPLVGIAATLVGGVASTRLGRRRPFIIVPGLVMIVAALGAFLATSDALIYASVLLLGFSAWIYLPALFTILMEISGMSPTRLALTIAAILAAGDVFGFLGPIAVGISTDVLGSYLPGLTALAFASATLFVASLLLPETGTAAGRERAAMQAEAQPVEQRR